MPSFPNDPDSLQAACNDGLAPRLSGLSTREMLDLLDSPEQGGSLAVGSLRR